MSDLRNPSRRRLLRSAPAAAMLATLPKAAESATGERWDREVDVIVVGSGTGLLGALVAAKAGLKVLVLEKHSALGGTSVISGGVLWVPNNRVQKREGIHDSREDSLVYLRHLALGQADEELIGAFLDRGPEMLDFVEANTDLRWRVSQRMGLIGDYHPEWQGSNVRGRSVEPVRPGTERAGGLLIAGLLQAITKLGVETPTECPVRRLVAREGAAGREVLGVEAEQHGKPLRLRARRGVLLACGGFERNVEMKRHFLRGPSPYTAGVETNTGDGIHMGMALGADLRNMNEVWGSLVYKADAEANGDHLGGITLMEQGGTPGVIMVNRYGERFCNEGGDYDTKWRAFCTWENWGELRYRNLPAFHVYDHVVREQFFVAGRKKDEPLPEWVTTAPTLGELAERLGIDRAGLLATVERFNRHAADGQDPDFHRGESHYDRHGRAERSASLRPLSMDGPFFGAEVSPADLGTCGGLRVDGQARVIDVSGHPIVGLYASGNTTGVGSPGASYGGGGGTLGPAMTFAFIAGSELARRS